MEKSFSMPWNRGTDAEDSTATSVGEVTGPLRYRTLEAMHRRLWSWHWSSGGDSALDMEIAAQLQPPKSSAERQEGTAAVWSGGFPAVRGGVAVFTLAPRKSFTIAVGCESDMEGSRAEDGQSLAPWLGVRVGSQSAELVYHSGSGYGVQVLASVSCAAVGYGDGSRAAFWFSFDPYNRVLKYGKGSRMRENTFLCYSFTGPAYDVLEPEDRDSIDRLFSPLAKLVELQHFAGPEIVCHTIYEASMLEERRQDGLVMFDEAPLLSDPSPRLLEAESMLLQDFSRRDYSLPMQLPPVAQGLCQQLMQPWLTLDSVADGERVSLRDAIQHSLATPGAFLHKLLQEKARSLPSGMPACTSQLTVSLAPADGSAPGPAFTLEILPAGHHSAPHDNARTYGVLRVLHGYLEVALFDDDLAEEDPVDEVELDNGDAMWFSPTWYQNHAMRNDNDTFCCYLLGRRYAEDDHVRWPYIRYQDAEGKVSSCHPDADCTFHQLHAAVTAELEAALAENPELLTKPSGEESDSANDRIEAWVSSVDSAFEFPGFQVGPAREPASGGKARRYGCAGWSVKWRNVTLEEEEAKLEPRFSLDSELELALHPKLEGKQNPDFDFRSNSLQLQPSTESLPFMWP